MRVLLGALDPALAELAVQTDAAALRELSSGLVVACLFTDGIVMPDVFLYNNPVLERLVLDGKKQRSFFSEAMRHGLVHVYKRHPGPVDFGQLLTAVQDDTLMGVPMGKPLAIQPRAHLVAERLANVVPSARMETTATLGSGSSGERLAARFETHVRKLRKSPVHSERALGFALEGHAVAAHRHLRNLDNAGLRRATIVWLTASRRTPDVIDGEFFARYPYRAILDRIPRFDVRQDLRREFLEIALMYHANLIDVYSDASLYWPTSAASARRSDVLDRYRRRARSLDSQGRVPLRLTAWMPPLRDLLQMGSELPALRAGGDRFFQDLQCMERGIEIPKRQVQEDLHAYAAHIQKVSGSRYARPISIASGLLSTVGVGFPPAAVIGGVMSTFSTFAPSRRWQITLQRMPALAQRAAPAS